MPRRTVSYTGVHIFFRIDVLGFLGYIPRSGIAESKGSSIVIFISLETSILFSLQATLSAFLPTMYRVPPSPHPHQHLLFVDLLMIAILTGMR